MEKSPIQKLIALKRFEQPSPRFFNSVEKEFHRRLAEETLKREQNSLKAYWERAVDFLSEYPFAIRQLAPVAIAAGVVVMASMSFMKNESPANSPIVGSAMAAAFRLTTTQDDLAKIELPSAPSLNDGYSDIIKSMEFSKQQASTHFAKDEFEGHVITPVVYEESRITF